MKKILSLLGTITLIGTSKASLVACNTQQYSENELKKLKQENKINTDKQEIKENLEWIEPQEKPFDTIDNKWYFVIWRGNKELDWRIIKFQNTKDIRLAGGFKYVLDFYGDRHDPNKINLVFDAEINNLRANNQIWTDNSINFNCVYRWNLTTQEPDLIIDDKGNIKVNE